MIHCLVCGRVEGDLKEFSRRHTRIGPFCQPVPRLDIDQWLHNTVTSWMDKDSYSIVCAYLGGEKIAAQRCTSRKHWHLMYVPQAFTVIEFIGSDEWVQEMRHMRTAQCAVDAIQVDWSPYVKVQVPCVPVN